MRRVKIGVIDPEEEYVTAFASYLQRWNGEVWDVSAFTDVNTLVAHLEKRTLHILIATDESLLEEICFSYEIIGLWLCGQDMQRKEMSLQERDGKKFVTYRFQSMVEIGKCISHIIQERMWSPTNRITSVICYSVVGRCGCTTFAKEMVSKETTGKWLYVGMEDYSSVSFESEEYRKNMENFLYYWKERKEECLKELVEKCNGFVEAGFCLWDRKQVNEEDVAWLLLRMSKTNYKGVVFDVGSGMLENLNMLKQFDYVIVPYQRDRISITKKNNFEIFLQWAGLEELQQSIHYLDMENAQEKDKMHGNIIGGYPT